TPWLQSSYRGVGPRGRRRAHLARLLRHLVPLLQNTDRWIRCRGKTLFACVPCEDHSSRTQQLGRAVPLRCSGVWGAASARTRPAEDQARGTLLERCGLAALSRAPQERGGPLEVPVG